MQYFYESAKSENFAKTAEKHFVPTSSVSGSVRRLEKELGCSLFDRSSNRLTLNQNGKRMYQALQVAFDAVGQAIKDLSAANEDNREIRMLVRAMRGNITDYIIEHNKEKPHIRFQINFDNAEEDFEKYDIIIDEKSEMYPAHRRIELCRIDLAVFGQHGFVRNDIGNLPDDAVHRLGRYDLREFAFHSDGEFVNDRRVDAL